MKILSISKHESVYVETDDIDRPTYIRSLHSRSWQRVIGESIDTVFYDDKLESEYQKFISDNPAFDCIDQLRVTIAQQAAEIERWKKESAGWRRNYDVATEQRNQLAEERDTAQAALATARVEILEEAAKECEKMTWWLDKQSRREVATKAASAIRNLANQETGNVG